MILPIDAVLPEITAALRRDRNLVIQAPPGSGKTTRVPSALLAAGLAGDGEVFVLQPRRIAARMAAMRVAEEAGEAPGRSIGYRVRFEECGGPSTRLWFVTEGVLMRRLVADPELRGIGLVALDEFHERSLHADVAMALLRRLQRGPRPDLKLVVMSATLDAEPAAAFLDAPVIRAEGRRFDVSMDYAARPDDRPLALQVAAALDRLVAQGLDGDVLVFVPGAAEIRQSMDACEQAVRREGLVALPLHGDLPMSEQDRAVRPSDRRRVVFSTNVAETSVTIDGVVAVIDGGLARVSSHSPWSGLKTLRVVRVSKASATQRAGRAGRTRPGRCVRLYTRSDFDARPEHDVPEVARADLAETVLALRALGLDPRTGLDWFEPPPPAALQAADALLSRLGALDAAGAVTPMGRRLLRLPLHPRQARLVVEAADRGLLEHGCLLASLIAERDVRRSSGARRLAEAGPIGDVDPAALSPWGFLDPIEAAEAVHAALADRSPRDAARRLGLEPSTMDAVVRARDQLLRLARGVRLGGKAAPTEPVRTALSKALLAAWPDRIGRVRRAAARGRGGSEFVLATGGTADLPDAALLPEGELLVAVDAAQRVGAADRSDGRGSSLLVRMAVPVTEDWLFELFLDAVRETEEVRFNPATERVEATRRVTFEGLVLEERPWATPDPDRVASALADAARGRGLTFFRGPSEDVDGFLARVSFLAAHRPDLELPPFDDATLARVLADLCRGRRSFADLRAAGVLGALNNHLDRAQRRALGELAPESVRLPAGRSLKIEYSLDAPPSVASRLQDFFGLDRGPAVLGGALPLLVHLRSPAGRDVQVTTDLPGFWAREYPALARELRRRYPRHAWPDDPVHARPPAKR